MKMPSPSSTAQTLRAENAELRARLEEAEETLRAIRAGEVDALVVEGPGGPQLFTLQGLDAEQSRFRGDLLAQVSDSVIAVDNEEHITFLNATAERQYGVRADEVVGRKLDSVITRYWPSPEAEAEMWTAMSERGEWHGELIHRTHDGRELHIESSVAALRGPDGERIGVVRTIRDVSARKQLELEKAEALRLLDTLLTRAPIGFVFLDRSLRFVRINDRLAEINGSSVAAHLGRPVAEILPTLEAPLREITERILATGQPVLDHEFFGQTAREPGVARYWNESWYPVYGERGEIIGFGGVVEEITERKRAEDVLRNVNERFALAVKCSHVVLWQQDLELRFTWLHNPAPGIDGSDAVGKRDEDLLERAEDAAVIVSLKRGVIRSGVGLRKEFSPQIQGVIHCFEVLMEPLRDAAGRITGITGAAIDITDRKRSEEALRESEQQFRALALATSDVIYRMSADWSTMLPLDGRQLVPSSDHSLAAWSWLDRNLPQDEHSRVRHAISEAIARKTLFELVHRVRRPDGSIGWTFSRAVPILDERGDVISWFGAASDITERKAAEDAVRAAEAQLADRAVQLESLVAERTEELTTAQARLLAEADERKRLEAEIATSIESERGRLGQELHDGLVQELTGIGMMMHVLTQALTDSAPPQASEARRLCRMMETAHGNARDLAKSFYPVELEQHGLVAALEEIAHRAHKHFGVSCVVQANSEATTPETDPTTAVQIFRIAQEAVQNAGKHSEATRILIDLSKKDGAWLLTVKDNGVGLPESSGKESGMGLRIMQYRARLIQGTLTASNAEGGGVLVSCSAPAV